MSTSARIEDVQIFQRQQQLLHYSTNPLFNSSTPTSFPHTYKNEFIWLQACNHYNQPFFLI